LRASPLYAVQKRSSSKQSKNGYGVNVDKFLRKRGVIPEVEEARGYIPYAQGDISTVLAADERFGQIEYLVPQKLTRQDRERGIKHKPDRRKSMLDWVVNKVNNSREGGHVMLKYALPQYGPAERGNPYNPLPQLRPVAPIPGRPYGHDHQGMTHTSGECRCGVRHGDSWTEAPMDPEARKAHERGKRHQGDDTPPIRGPHRHVPGSKYLIPPGPHGKRWDTNPLCTPERFLEAERVWLHLEGCIKLDALVSRGEVGADVPSVTMAMRSVEDESSGDWPRVAGFWRGYRPQEQAGELDKFLEIFVLRVQDPEFPEPKRPAAPVIVACDSDWLENPLVATPAFVLCDHVSSRGLDCVVAAPPAPDGRKVGTDDYLADRRKSPLRHLAVRLLRSPGFEDFATEYRSVQKGQRRRIENDLRLLEWYGTHSTPADSPDPGLVKRSTGTIARLFGTAPDGSWVRKATNRLIKADALEVVEGYYSEVEDWAGFTDTHSPKSLPVVLRLREDLRPSRLEMSVGEWLKSLGAENAPYSRH
jgi:hypothetical protein